MSLVLRGGVTAMGPGLTTAVGASGGTAPYTYSIVAGGAGGSIVAQIGGGAIYTSPSLVPTNPANQIATLRVTDAELDTADLQILIGDPILLFCEIIQKEMNLQNGRVYLYNQKIMQPTDSGLYIAIGVLNCKPFGNTNRPDSSGQGLNSGQSVNMYANLDINIMSRSTEALFRKEEIIMALNSTYAQAQQERNSFFISKLPPGAQFVNLSEIDGSAIPYRFNITVGIQYFIKKVKAIGYFDDFGQPNVVTEE